MVCSHCGSNDVDVDADGATVCIGCGVVLTDVAIVSEVGFSENSAGQSSVVGQFVTHGQSSGLSASAKKLHPGSGGYSRDSREQTIANGRKLAQHLADSLKLRSHHVDAAARYFQLAVQHNFIQGRRTVNVVAACLYIVCRREKTSHLLLDFADVLQVNLYVLGATLLKFIRVLHISLPIIDPSLYIHRFAARLELVQVQSSSNQENPADLPDGQASVHVVAMTALRLVARMKRDWLQVGRRPSGICGACLLIACRMHGYRRTQREILDVVNVCEATLRRRLVEFVSSDAADLTFNEFESMNENQHLNPEKRRTENGEEECANTADPPSYTRAVKAEEQQERLRLRAAEVEAQLNARGMVGGGELSQVWATELNKLLETKEFQREENPIQLHQDPSVNKLIVQHIAASNLGLYDDKQRVKSQPVDEANSIQELALIGEETSGKPIVEQKDAPPMKLDDVDDDEIDQYLLDDEECSFKTGQWESLHHEFIAAQAEKQRNLAASNPHGTSEAKRPHVKKKDKIRASSEFANVTSIDSKHGIKQNPGDAPPRVPRPPAAPISSKVNYALLAGLLNTKPEPDSQGSSKKRKMEPVEEDAHDNDDYYDDDDDAAAAVDDYDD